MTRGAKIALGCGCAFLLAAGAAVALLGVGAFWAKSKLDEVTGGLEGLAAKAEQIQALERKVEAHPYTPPAGGVLAEDRLVTFLECRKRMAPVYERFKDDLRALESKGKSGEGPRSVSEAIGLGGKAAAAFTEMRLAHLQALADLGMSEREYREIRRVVYGATWAAGQRPEDLPAEAGPNAGASATPFRGANADLLRRHEAEIRAYAMPGSELLDP